MGLWGLAVLRKALFTLGQVCSTLTVGLKKPRAVIREEFATWLIGTHSSSVLGLRVPLGVLDSTAPFPFFTP